MNIIPISRLTSRDEHIVCARLSAKLSAVRCLDRQALSDEYRHQRDTNRQCQGPVNPYVTCNGCPDGAAVRERLGAAKPSPALISAQKLRRSLKLAGYRGTLRPRRTK